MKNLNSVSPPPFNISKNGSSKTRSFPPYKSELCKRNYMYTYRTGRYPAACIFLIPSAPRNTHTQKKLRGKSKETAAERHFIKRDKKKKNRRNNKRAKETLIEIVASYCVIHGIDYYRFSNNSAHYLYLFSLAYVYFPIKYH